MIKLIELTKNYKPEAIKIEWIVKQPTKIVAVVKDKYRCEIVNGKPEIGWDNDTPIKVYCSCPDFQFRWAYVLWKYDALLHPENFVLEPPKVRNPGMRPGACKHLAAVARALLEDK